MSTTTSVTTARATPTARGGGLLAVVVAFGTLLTHGLFAGLLGVAWPSMRLTFGVALDALGWFLLAQMGGYVLFGALGGRLVDRFGVAPLLTGGLLLRVVTLGIGLLLPRWGVFLWVGLAYGISGGAMDTALNTYAATYFRPRVLTWMHACFGIGTTLGSLLMTSLLVLASDWRVGVGVVLAQHVLLTAAYIATRDRWQLDRREEPPDAPAPAAAVPRPSLRATLALPVVLASIATFFLYTGIEIGLGNWGFTLLSESRGMSAQAAGLTMTLFWAALTAGRILFAFVELRLVTMVRLSTVGALAGTVLLALPLNPRLAWLALPVIGLALAPIFPTLITLTPRRAGRRHAPNAIGFQIAAAGLGGALLSALAGRLGTLLGLESIALFFVVLALGLLLLHELAVRLAAARGA